MPFAITAPESACAEKDIQEKIVMVNVVVVVIVVRTCKFLVLQIIAFVMS